MLWSAAPIRQPLATIAFPRAGDAVVIFGRARVLSAHHRGQCEIRFRTHLRAHSMADSANPRYYQHRGIQCVPSPHLGALPLEIGYAACAARFSKARKRKHTLIYSNGFEKASKVTREGFSMRTRTHVGRNGTMIVAASALPSAPHPRQCLANAPGVTSRTHDPRAYFISFREELSFAHRRHQQHQQNKPEKRYKFVKTGASMRCCR